MASRKIQFAMVFTLVGLLLIGAIVLNGCKKKPEPAAPAEEKEAATVEVKQTICPVMEGPINKDIFTEYKGKKVYFCCAGCKGTFEKDPDKYIAELPQFKK